MEFVSETHFWSNALWSIIVMRCGQMSERDKDSGDFSGACEMAALMVEPRRSFSPGVYVYSHYRALINLNTKKRTLAPPAFVGCNHLFMFLLICRCGLLALQISINNTDEDTPAINTQLPIQFPLLSFLVIYVAFKTLTREPRFKSL